VLPLPTYKFDNLPKLRLGRAELTLASATIVASVAIAAGTAMAEINSAAPKRNATALIMIFPLLTRHNSSTENLYQNLASRQSWVLFPVFLEIAEWHLREKKAHEASSHYFSGPATFN
jgi:hypothetical protein